MTTTALARPVRLDLETFSRAVAMHPELVRRLVALGLLDAYVDTAGELWFPPPSSPLRPGSNACAPGSA